MSQVSLYKRSSFAEIVELDRECLILNTEKHTVTGINEIGGICWSMLQQMRSARELAAEIHSRYDIGLPQAEADVEAFLEQLLQLELVEHAE